jgi:hypothetical protein
VYENYALCAMKYHLYAKALPNGGESHGGFHAGLDHIWIQRSKTPLTKTLSIAVIGQAVSAGYELIRARTRSNMAKQAVCKFHVCESEVLW